MIEIEIPQDISKYESKLIGPFTTRQTICVVGLAVGCISSFFAVSSAFGEDTPLRLLVPMIIAIPLPLSDGISLTVCTLKNLPNQFLYRSY